MDKLIEKLRSIRLRVPSWLHLPRSGKPGTRQIVFWGVTVLVAAGAFFFVRGMVSCWQITPLPGVRPAWCPGDPAASVIETPSLNAKGTPIAPPPTPQTVAVPDVEYPQWDGGSRINIAFFGLRGGEISGEDCPQCTDTIIVFTVDPVSKTAGMLSVPRDLFVNIPGFGYSRINTAWTDGEGAKLPGGGPGLAMRTVSNVLGVPIQYYVQVSFDTFVQFVDMIHGIDIYNEETLILDRVGTGTDHF